MCIIYMKIMLLFMLHFIMADGVSLDYYFHNGSVGGNLQPGGGMHPPNPSLG
jgi:hypothetical protein